MVVMSNSSVRLVVTAALVLTILASGANAATLVCEGAVEGCAPPGSELRLAVRGPAEVAVGAEFGYTVRLANRGTASAQVRIGQLLPVGARLDRRDMRSAVVRKTTARYRLARAAWGRARARASRDPQQEQARRRLIAAQAALRLARTGCSLPVRETTNAPRAYLRARERVLGPGRVIRLRCRLRLSSSARVGTAWLLAGSREAAPLAAGYPRKRLFVRVVPAPTL